MSNVVIMEAATLLATLRDWANGKFVEQISGKGLSTEDFTSALLAKLNAIESGAEVNNIVGVKLNNVELVIDANRKINIDLSDYALKSDISSAYIPKGDIQASSLVAALLIEDNLGDVYNLTDTLTITSSNVGLFKNAVVGQTFPAGSNIVIIKDGNDYLFDVLSGFVDLSSYYTKSEVNTLLSAKADDVDLTAHTTNSDIHVTTTDKSNWNAKYDKPVSGIPKTDLSSGVQSSLDLADSALQSHQTIKQDGITGATINRFGVCSTAAATAAKEVSITSGTFSLESGVEVTVKFANANTANSPTLAVGSTDAKNIFYKGVQITTDNAKNMLKGVVKFIYDGTQYHIIGAQYVTVGVIEDLGFMTEQEALAILNA